MKRFENHVGVVLLDVTSHIDQVFTEDIEQKATTVHNQEHTRSSLVKQHLNNVKK